MDYTKMRFKDILVSDLGSLPADATINEDLYDLLTLPYSLGTDVNSRITTHNYQGNPGRYRIGMTLSQGSMEAKLVTEVRVIDGKAEITTYNGEVSMLRVSGPRVAHDRVKLKFADEDYEGSPSPFQEYLAEMTSATLWMNGIANNKRADVDIIKYNNVTKESIGILYHMMNNMDIEPIPAELRDRLYPECLRIKLGDGEHKVSVLRPNAKVDGEHLEERFGHTDSSLTNAKIEDQLVNKVFELIDEKRLNIEETPPTETQELIAYQMYDIWREVKEQNGYPDWALKCHPSGDPNKMYFQMNALGQQSIVAVGRYATHEEYPEGCLTIQTTCQPFKSHSAKSESDLCGVVMDHILYELHMINEDMLSDVSPNRKEIER